MNVAYFLDTNTILNNPFIFNKFNDCDILLDYTVINEIDNKKYHKDLGAIVRIIQNYLKQVREAGGVTENNCNIKYVTSTKENLSYLGGDTPDNRIINTAKEYSNFYDEFYVVSNDILMGVKADALDLNILSGDFEDNKISTIDYNGYVEYYLDDYLIDTLYNQKFLDIKYIKEIEIYPHMFIILKRFNTNSGSLIAKVNNKCNCIELLNDIGEVWGLKHKNVQQLMALHLLLDPDIPLVVLEGPAGTGKTLITLASALELTMDKDFEEINNTLLLKPTKDVTDDDDKTGFLPGDLSQKLDPYMQSYYDNLRVLLGPEYRNLDMFNTKIDALNHMRGRTIPDTFVVIDEFQNVKKSLSKVYLTRAGINSKYVLLGDITQIDDKKLNAYNNALTHTVNSFLGDDFFGYIKFTEDEIVRSPLAKKSAELL